MGVSDSWWTRGDSVPDHYVVSVELPPSSRRRSTPHRGGTGFVKDIFLIIKNLDPYNCFLMILM